MPGGKKASSGGEKPVGFSTGREWDKETGLYFYRARYYDPMEGRFIQKDPIGFKNGINLYNYVRANPINNTDPKGESIAAAAAVVTVAVVAGGFYLLLKCIDKCKDKFKDCQGKKWACIKYCVNVAAMFAQDNPAISTIENIGTGTQDW